MSSLTIALGSLGAVIVAALVAHGAWAARRAGPKRALPGRSGAEPREPVMGDLPPLEPAELASEHDAGAEVEAPAGAAARRRPRRSAGRIDALIDAIATLRIDAPIAGASVLPNLPATRRAGGKPFAVEGLDHDTGDWETPTAAATYTEFQAGLQLANRTGALNEIEYSEFVQKVQAFADAIGALADFPDMLEAVATARELDHFAGDHDAQLAVHLQARNVAWSVGYVLQQARRHGFVPGVVPGRLVLPAADEGGPPVLTLAFDPKAALADDHDLSSVRDLTLAFDVPQTDAAAEPFAAWQAAAQGLAASMDAALVDDDGRPLGPEGFAAIDRQLRELYGQLAARDLAAGSTAARRLFS